MPSFDTVNAPTAASYTAPLIDFRALANLPNAYYQGQQNRRNQDIATAFPGGLPMGPGGQPDYAAIMQVLAQKGGLNQAIQLAPVQADAAQRAQAAQLSPLLTGAPNAAPMQPAGPGVSQPTSLPAPAAVLQVTGGDQAGSVADLVGAALPADSAATGAVITNVARAIGVDPNAALTPDQGARVARLLAAYVARRPPQAAPAASPSATAANPADKVANAFSAFAPQPAAAQPGAMRDALASPSVPAAAPAPAATAAPRGPILPQVPLPPGFNDPQRAIMALRNEAARLASNPYGAPQAKRLDAWADKIETSLQPIKVGQADTIIDPRTGRVLVQGPAAAAFGARGPTQTLDADAARYRETGTLPPNMGRGVQGQQEAQAIRTRAVEQELALGGNPDTWPARWQQFRAAGVGLNTGERVRATREENLKLILKVTKAAIPAALEQSAKVDWRTGQNPLTAIIQRGQVMTSDPNLKTFGMANLQLAEGWARAMNPTGVMRESDRDKALEFLSTQDTKETYAAAVRQLQTQITREYDSIRARDSDTPTLALPKDSPAASPGADAQGWVTLPSGVRYREKPAQQ